MPGIKPHRYKSEKGGHMQAPNQLYYLVYKGSYGPALLLSFYEDLFPPGKPDPNGLHVRLQQQRPGTGSQHGLRRRYPG